MQRLRAYSIGNAWVADRRDLRPRQAFPQGFGTALDSLDLSSGIPKHYEERTWDR